MCIKASHISLQRGISRLYVETNRNTIIQFIYKFLMLMRLMSIIEYLIAPKGTKFMGSGKLGLNLQILASLYRGTHHRWMFACFLIRPCCKELKKCKSKWCTKVTNYIVIINKIPTVLEVWMAAPQCTYCRIWWMSKYFRSQPPNLSRNTCTQTLFLVS